MDDHTVPAWVTRWVQAQDDALEYDPQDAPGPERPEEEGFPLEYLILEGQAVVAVDVGRYATWLMAHLDAATRRVDWTDLGAGVAVSTVFCLGVWQVPGRPELSSGGAFETMIEEQGRWREERWQYATWAEAEAGHAAVVALVRTVLQR